MHYGVSELNWSYAWKTSMLFSQYFFLEIIEWYDFAKLTLLLQKQLLIFSIGCRFPKWKSRGFI